MNFEAKDADTTLDDDGSNPTDDRVRAEAARMHNGRTASHLLGVPLLPDYLESGPRGVRPFDTQYCLHLIWFSGD